MMNLPVESSTFEMDGHAVNVYGIRTGTVQVKKSHFAPSGGMLQILVDWRWADPMPIYTWLIEHPEGFILIDTGENVQVKENWYFDCDPTTGYVNRKILKFELEREMEIGRRLYHLGIRPDDIRWVVLTHLHIDHIDGLMYFPRAEVVVSQAEWSRPYGAMKCILPPGLRPNKILFQKDEYFKGQYPLTEDGRVRVVATPGHTYGHQSVIVETDDLNLFFAGDTSFTQQQLLADQVPGIHANRSEALDTYARIKHFAASKSLIYLPSHDWSSGKRLLDEQTFG